MTTPIKTQCPHCHTTFTIKKTQLNQKSANICCEHCQQSFLVNNNLIVTANSQVSSNDTADEYKADIAPTSQAVANKDFASKNTEVLIHDEMFDDGLIHDDMEMEDTEEEALEYGSLDSMEAWLTQAADSTPTSSINKNDALTTTLDTSASIVNTQENAASANAFFEESPSVAKAALSSAAANDIHASINDKTDESWLEKLLKEQQSKEVHTAKTQSDLSELLSSMGVAIKDDERASAARSKKQQDRASFSPTPAGRSVASLLWLVGCLVLTLLLFAQYVIFNLENLVKNPAHAERLEKICSIAVCSLPSANLAALNTSDIKHRPSHISSASDFSDISATLNNQSTKAQLLPHIKVSVYGNNTIIGEFIAAPDDYLLSTQSQLGAAGRKRLLFTIPVPNTQISKVIVSPVY